MMANMVWMLPASMSVTAGGKPRYGMCTTKTPASLFSNSIVRCEALPLPTEPYGQPPGILAQVLDEIA